MPRTPEQLAAAVLDVASQALRDSETIPRLLLSRDPDTREVLTGVAAFVVHEPDVDLAMLASTHFLELSRIRAELITRGWHYYFTGKAIRLRR